MRLVATGEFDKTHAANRIALLAVYMPVMRQQIRQFVQIWNVHTIRRQPNRPHVVHGKPAHLYYAPPEGVVDHGVDPSLDLVNELAQDYDDWGKNNQKHVYRHEANLLQILRHICLKKLFNGATASLPS